MKVQIEKEEKTTKREEKALGSRVMGAVAGGAGSPWRGSVSGCRGVCRRAASGGSGGVGWALAEIDKRGQTGATAGGLGGRRVVVVMVL